MYITPECVKFLCYHGSTCDVIWCAYALRNSLNEIIMKRHIWLPYVALNWSARRENHVGRSYCSTINWNRQNTATSYEVYGTIGAMSRDCHMFTVLLPFCGIVLLQSIDQMFVRRDADLAKVAIESKRTPVQRYKVQKFIQSDSVSLFLF